MNRRGFTLVELLATLVILSLVAGLTVSVILFNINSTKTKTEEIFVETIEDAMEIYLDSDAKGLTYSNKVCTLNKTHHSVDLYKTSSVKYFSDVINSSYKPLDVKGFVNPANKDVGCNPNARIYVYRDDDYVYYYKISKNAFGCLKNTSGYITNLPEGSEGC